MTSCFVCATLNLGRKKSTGTEPWISEFGYIIILLPSRDMAEIPLKRRKSTVQPNYISKYYQMIIWEPINCGMVLEKVYVRLNENGHNFSIKIVYEKIWTDMQLHCIVAELILVVPCLCLDWNIVDNDAKHQLYKTQLSQSQSRSKARGRSIKLADSTFSLVRWWGVAWRWFQIGQRLYRGVPSYRSDRMRWMYTVVYICTETQLFI